MARIALAFVTLVLVGCDETATPSPTAPSSTAPSSTAPASSVAAAPPAFVLPPAMLSAPTGPAAPAVSGPRALADAAFNDAMRAFETGQPTAAALVPRALTAYQSVGQLDTDGLFHLALLHLAAGDPKSARLTAEQILVQRPVHILALATAGRAATSMGDADAARAYYRRFLAAWDTEQGQMPEYVDHAALLQGYREEALTIVGGAPTATAGAASSPAVPPPATAPGR